MGYHGGLGDLSSASSLDELLRGHARFTVHRRLGAGGMGVVYEAYDRQREAMVALKTLKSVSPGALYLFKKEFRALADVTHPNLVTLYELLVAREQWFFTMELLDGVSLLAHLRTDASEREPEPEPGPPTETASIAAAPSVTGETMDSPTGDVARILPGARPVAAARIRPVFAQLADALCALHATGHLHCDIKPSNVLVTPQGRVVVLDYGVITDLGRGDPTAADGMFRGTPAYASPEQAALVREPTAASDWYAVGVMLYEALTGRRPFAGSAKSVLERKQREDPVEPVALSADVDPALSELCMALLARAPGDRPDGAAVVRALRVTSAPVAVAAARELASARTLVGRERELDALRAAFARARQGVGTAVRVKGRSGMGKSSVVGAFLDEVARDDQALVLAGRCYQRESVPHQAVDGLVDALSRYLLELPRDEADRLMPVDVLAMARAFPVLGRVEAVAQARRRSTVAVTDPVELRRRAHAALRELFARIAERQPLVLFIDDLQWGDVDSAPFLSDLLQPPVPPLLLIVSYRSEEVDASPLLHELLEPTTGGDAPLADTAEIAVGRLSLSQACALAETLLRAAGAANSSPAAAEKIARESGGNPYFVHELVRHVCSAGGGAIADAPELAAVLRARAAALSESARRLLYVVAVAGRPTDEDVARRAANLGGDHPRALAELVAAHLVRTTAGEGLPRVETYHDRIREALVDHLEPAPLRALHLDLAHSLEAAGRDDPEALAIHYAAAGDRAPAAECAERAGDKAADALAFERAATYYRLALELADPAAHARVASLGRRLGEALVNAGRGAEAPEVYLAAAAVATAGEAQDLQVRAGSELLRSGRVDEGIEVLRTPLQRAGITLARSKASAAVALLVGRGVTRARGLRFKRRDVSQIAPDMLTRIDACHAAAAGLAMVEPVRGAYVQTRHLLSALRHGDLFRIGRALTYEGGFLCIGGRATRPRVDRILRAVHDIADELQAPYLFALQHTHSALAEYQCGEWARARDHALRAEATYRDECTGSAWELSSVQLYGLWSMYWLGELRELTRRARASLRDARARGDLYATVSLEIGLPSIAGLVVDDVDGTRARAERAARQWPHADYHLQHFWTAVALTHCDLYGGDPIAAFQRMEEHWPRLGRAFLLRVVMVRAETLHLRARCALAVAGVAEDPRRYLALAGKLAARLARVRMAWCAPAAGVVRAALAATAGEVDRAAALLEQSERGLRACDTRAFATAARRRRGELVGGDAGAALIAEADAWLRAQGVVDPQRMCRLLAPGFDRRWPIAGQLED